MEELTFLYFKPAIEMPDPEMSKKEFIDYLYSMPASEFYRFVGQDNNENMSTEEFEKKSLELLLKNGIKPIVEKKITWDEALIRKHYAEHEKKGWFPELIDMLEGHTCNSYVLAGEDAISEVRRVVGHNEEPGEGTIRRMYFDNFGFSKSNNGCHASDKKWSLFRELAIHFGKSELDSLEDAVKDMAKELYVIDLTRFIEKNPHPEVLREVRNSKLGYIGLVEPGEEILGVSLEKYWRMSGNSYVSILNVQCEKDGKTVERGFVAKALTSLGMLGKLDSLAELVVRRIELLRSAGINVPKVYGVEKGVIEKELIPLEYDEAKVVFGPAVDREIEELRVKLLLIGAKPPKDLENYVAFDVHAQPYIYDCAGDIIIPLDLSSA